MFGSDDMLKKLEPVTRLGAVSRDDPREAANPGNSGFSGVIDRVERDAYGVRKTVSIPAGFEISPGDRNRLARAVDQADAADSKRAVILMGRRAFEVDVAKRHLEREWSNAGSHAGDGENDHRVISGVDTLVIASPTAEDRANSSSDSSGPAAELLSRLSDLGNVRSVVYADPDAE
jgi:hypothetical protein